MLCRCPRCTDQKNTIKLLCDQVLYKDLFELVNSFNRCEKCDEKINIKCFVNHSILYVGASSIIIGGCKK